MSQVTSYVRTDDAGVMRVADTHVMLDSVVAAYEQGHSPETIRSQYPSLTLEQVYGAITYYLAHREEVGEYLKRQDAAWAAARERAETTNKPLLEKLRAARRSESKRAS
jgi:uncharacterized protein (DUF433 family)